MDDSESVSEYFARVNIILMKLERYDITTSAREIKRVVMNSLTSRFPNETSVLAMRGDFKLAELELGLIRVEKLRSESSRSAPSNALAVAHAGNGPTGTGGGTRGRRRKGRRSGGRHGDGPSSTRTSTDAPPAAPAPATRGDATTVVRMATAAAAAAATSGDVATIARMATAPPAAQPLEQLGTTTPSAAARESASSAYTTTSGRTPGSPAARDVSAMRQGGTFPRRLRDYNARPSATFKYGTIFRPCRTVWYRSPSRTAVQHRSCHTERQVRVQVSYRGM